MIQDRRKLQLPSQAGAQTGRATRAPAARWRAAALLLSALVLSAQACPPVGEEEEAADGSGSNTNGDAPANAEQRVDQLPRGELQAFCRDLNLELSMRFDNRRLATYECTRLYIERGDSLSCTQAVNDCLRGSAQASPAAPRPADYQLDNAECERIGACRLSVGELDTCLGDRFDQSDQLMGRITCSLANDPEAVDAALRAAESRRVPDSCVRVADVCPELL